MSVQLFNLICENPKLLHYYTVEEIKGFARQWKNGTIGVPFVQKYLKKDLPDNSTPSYEQLLESFAHALSFSDSSEMKSTHESTEEKVKTALDNMNFSFVEMMDDQWWRDLHDLSEHPNLLDNVLNQHEQIKKLFSLIAQYFNFLSFRKNAIFENQEARSTLMNTALKLCLRESLPPLDPRKEPIPVSVRIDEILADMNILNITSRKRRFHSGVAYDFYGINYHHGLPPYNRYLNLRIRCGIITYTGIKNFEGNKERLKVFMDMNRKLKERLEDVADRHHAYNDLYIEEFPDSKDLCRYLDINKKEVLGDFYKNTDILTEKELYTAIKVLEPLRLSLIILTSSTNRNIAKSVLTSLYNLQLGMNLIEDDPELSVNPHEYGLQFI